MVKEDQADTQTYKVWRIHSHPNFEHKYANKKDMQIYVNNDGHLCLYQTFSDNDILLIHKHFTYENKLIVYTVHALRLTSK